MFILLETVLQDPYEKDLFCNLVWSWECYSYSLSWAGIAWWSPFLSRSTTSLNSVFLFLECCYTEVREPSLLYYLSVAGGRIVGFIPFPRVLAKSEMQIAPFRIWTWVTEFPSYIDNCYIMSASIRIHIGVIILKKTYICIIDLPISSSLKYISELLSLIQLSLQTISFIYYLIADIYIFIIIISRW